MKERRDEFLLEMYRQMFNDINRHLSLIWQAVGVLVGALALFALAEKGVVSVDVSTSIIIILCGWLVAHILDSNYWYNRNLVIIANIERQFLNRDDTRLIHYYFATHRPSNAMMKQLHVQRFFAALFAIVVIGYHFSTRVAPGFSSAWANFESERSLPYITAVLCAVYLYWFKGNRDASYGEFLKNSPGRDFDSSGIDFGAGHGRGASFTDWFCQLPKSIFRGKADA